MKQLSLLPAHLVRVAGFPFARLDALRCARSVAALEGLDAAADARHRAGTSLDYAISQERYSDNPMFDDVGVRKAFSKQVKQSRAFARVLADVDPPRESLAEVGRIIPRVQPLIDEVLTSHARWRAGLRAYAETFAREFELSRAALRDLYKADRSLQESVFLESVEAFDRVQQLLSTEGPRNARARQRERLAAMYAQRFCAKNDTNSICGPHSVAYFGPPVEEVTHIELSPDRLVRQTYFSHWAAQALLDAAVQRAGEQARRLKRLNPSAYIEHIEPTDPVTVAVSAVSWCVMEHDATSTFRRKYFKSPLSRAAADLLSALRVARMPSEIADLATALGLEVDEALGFIDELEKVGLVLDGGLLPPGLFYPLRAVAGVITSWPDSEAKTWALSEVASFERLVGEFACAPLEQRLALSHELTTRFVEATGMAATRGEGRHYADRALLHEDCHIESRSRPAKVHRELETTLPLIIAALELPQELSRERVREWFRARFGEGKRVAALDAHRAFDTDNVLEQPCSTPRAAALRTAMQRIRHALSRAAAGARGDVVCMSLEELEQALAAVEAPAHAAYISVDVMIRRPANQREQIVLAEAHGFAWLPTCLLDVLPPEHKERVIGQMRATLRELARGKQTGECVFLHTQATDRRFQLATHDLQLTIPTDERASYDLGELDLQLVGNEFEYRRGDDEIVPVAVYTNYPFVMYTSKIGPLFDDLAERFFPDSLLPPELQTGDSPRIMIGDMVVRRRLWRRPARAMREAFAATTEAELFRRAHQVRRELGCDARVFISMSGEPKPVLLDFHNVFLLEAFTNMLERQAEDAVVKFSEMLPGPDELVTRCPDGFRTSELRLGLYRT